MDIWSILVGTWFSFVNCYANTLMSKFIPLSKRSNSAKPFSKKFLRAGAFMENKTIFFIRLRYQHRFSFKETKVHKMREAIGSCYYARVCSLVHYRIYLNTVILFSSIPYVHVDMIIYNRSPLIYVAGNNSLMISDTYL